MLRGNSMNDPKVSTEQPLFRRVIELLDISSNRIGKGMVIKEGAHLQPLHKLYAQELSTASMLRDFSIQAS